ncbi:MAG: hypothetical protein U9N46_07675, partial [Euryarchaeota archaeon]|nr:hypothetical protein [Euryarchaeota archaeon]
LRVSAPLRLCVKLENNNAKTQRRDGAKNKSLRVHFTGIFDCALFALCSRICWHGDFTGSTCLANHKIT